MTNIFRGLMVFALGAFGAYGFSYVQWTMPVPPRFMATGADPARAMLKLAQVKSGELVADLGCGDGRIPIIAALEFGASGLCVERDPLLVADARANARMAGVADKITFVLGDVMDADLSRVDVVTLYLSPDLNRRLQGKLFSELRPGGRIVSQLHPMGDLKPEQTAEAIEERTGRKRPLYLWTVQ